MPRSYEAVIDQLTLYELIPVELSETHRESLLINHRIDHF